MEELSPREVSLRDALAGVMPFLTALAEEGFLPKQQFDYARTVLANCGAPAPPLSGQTSIKQLYDEINRLLLAGVPEETPVTFDTDKVSSDRARLVSINAYNPPPGPWVSIKLENQN